MHKILMTLVGAITFLSLAPTSSKAAIIGVSGDGSIIDAPDSVLSDGITSPLMLGFNEKQGVLLTDDLMVNADSRRSRLNPNVGEIINFDGVIAAGTKVNSHLILFNPQTTTTTTAKATWQFNGKILGIMADRPGLLEVASTPILGSLTTLYPDARIGARGLDPVGDSYQLIDSYTLELSLSANRPGDYIRVVTEVPEPMTILGIGTAVGFAGFFKQKMAKKQADKQNQA